MKQKKTKKKKQKKKNHKFREFACLTAVILAPCAWRWVGAADLLRRFRKHRKPTGYRYDNVGNSARRAPFLWLSVGVRLGIFVATRCLKFP